MPIVWPPRVHEITKYAAVASNKPPRSPMRQPGEVEAPSPDTLQPSQQPSEMPPPD